MTDSQGNISLFEGIADKSVFILALTNKIDLRPHVLNAVLGVADYALLQGNIPFHRIMEVGNDYLYFIGVHIGHFLQKCAKRNTCLVENLRLIRIIHRIDIVYIIYDSPTTGVIFKIGSSVLCGTNGLHRA